MPIDNKQFNELIGELVGDKDETLEDILTAEIERLEKNYGFRNRFILIGRGGGGQVSMCTTPMTESSKEAMLNAAKQLP